MPEIIIPSATRLFKIPKQAMHDLFLHNIRLPDGLEASLLIRKGLIAEIGALPQPTPAIPLLDGGGLMVLPGAIDMHVHFRTPGAEHKETLLSGALAAVKGGTTTCADMPNTSPQTNTLEALRAKQRLAQGAACQLLFNFGADAGNLAQVALAAQDPTVKALKIYMGPSTGQEGLAPQFVKAHFEQAGRLGLCVMVHAECVEMIEENQQRFPHDVHHHSHIRSPEAELAATRQALELAAKYGVRLYLAHVTNAGVVREARQSGLGDQVYVEVCPHHLLLSTERITANVENRYKVNPPLRDEVERLALFELLHDGIDALGSDHAPHALEEKNHPYDQAPSGIPGVEYLFPLAIDWWRRGVISLERMLSLTSGAPARLFGLNKGRIAPGYDADLVLVDPDALWTVGGKDDVIASKCGWTVYEGMELLGRPEASIVAGKVAYRRQGSGS